MVKWNFIEIKNELLNILKELSEESKNEIMNIEDHKLTVSNANEINELLIHKSNYNNSDSCRTVSVWRVIANTNLSTTLRVLSAGAFLVY